MTEITGKPEEIGPLRNKADQSKKKIGFEQSTVFRNILSEQLKEPVETSNAPTVSNGLPELEGAYQSAIIHQPDGSGTLAERTDNSIDLLETYASILSDPEKTLKQAYKLLEELAEQTNQINRELAQSPKTDQRLKQIITQLTTMVQVEQIKLTRGDYMDLT